MTVIGTSMAFYCGVLKAKECPYRLTTPFKEIGFLGVVFAGRGAALRRRVKSPIVQNILGIGKQIVLYLRPFETDTNKNSGMTFLDRRFKNYSVTNENLIFKYLGLLADIDDFIAIGRPQEKVTPSGFKRIYVATNSDWMLIVRDLIDRAVIIVWTFGLSDGIKWEIQQLVSRSNPTRILAYCPLGELTPIKKEFEWTRMRDELSTCFPKGLPKKIGKSVFMVFDEDWIPRWVEPIGMDPTQHGISHTICRSMNEVFRRMGLRVKPNKWLGVTSSTTHGDSSP